MHAFAAGWQPPAGFTRPSWDWDAQLGGSMFKHPREELVSSFQPNIKNRSSVYPAKSGRSWNCWEKGRMRMA